MPPGAGGPRGIMRSLGRDSSVTSTQIRPGTWKRILTYLRPYRMLLTWFLVVVVADSFVGVAPALVLGQIIDKGIHGSQAQSARIALIVTFAVLLVGIAVVDAGLSLVQRYASARIGEGLVYDMRTKVFAHVQRMPLAFFTRTQTGALVSRLNNDVQGAQEAFTDVLSSVVGNLISVAFVLATMFYLSWQLTLMSLVLLPAVPAAGALDGPPARGDHARGVRPERADEHHDGRAVQRRRRLARQAVRTSRP